MVPQKTPPQLDSSEIPIRDASLDSSFTRANGTSLDPSEDSPKSELHCVSLNVSGLHNKLKNGILDRYLQKFDIIAQLETNTDSPNLVGTLLEKHVCLSKEKVDPKFKANLGGIHGICVLLNPDSWCVRWCWNFTKHLIWMYTMAKNFTVKWN